MIDVFAKLAGQTIPAAQIAAARFVVQASLLLPFLALRGGFRLPPLHDAGLHLARGALILLATICFFAAVRVMPIADAMATFFVEPLILTLLSGLLLGEAVGWRRVLACLVGFGGALLVIKPSFALFGLTALLPLGTAICFAFYLLLTRTMAQRMSPVALQGWTALAALTLAVPVLVLAEGSGLPGLDPVRPQGRFWLYLIGVGLAATVAHLFIASAFAHAPATTLAPLQYLEIVGATLFGYMVFSDIPDQLTVLGVAIIIGSGLYVFFRERKVSRRARLAQGAPESVQG